MDELPNFETLAKLWLERDPRTQNMDEQARNNAILRLAEALRKRRSETNHENQDVGLIINVDKSSIIPGKGMAEDALNQLTKFVQERIDNEDRV